MKKSLSLKSVVAYVFLIAAIFSISGCGCTHEWTDATCTAPITCTKCGGTDGEALGHHWQEADCLNPSTCTVCGETDGAALGHDYVFEGVADIDKMISYEYNVCTRCDDKILLSSGPVSEMSERIEQLGDTVKFK